MIHVIEEALDVRVHDPFVSVAHCPVHNLKRGRTTTLRAKAMTAVTELCLEDWSQHLQQRLLHDAVPYRRDAQWPLPASRLGDVNPPYRLWPVRLGPQIRGERLQPDLGVACEAADGLPIHSRRPLVGLDLL